MVFAALVYDADLDVERVYPLAAASLEAARREGVEYLSGVWCGWVEIWEGEELALVVGA
jgi:hypothetical protein